MPIVAEVTACEHQLLKLLRTIGSTFEMHTFTIFKRWVYDGFIAKILVDDPFASVEFIFNICRKYLICIDEFGYEFPIPNQIFYLRPALFRFFCIP